MIPDTLKQVKHRFPIIPLEPHGKRPVLDKWQDPQSRAAFDLDTHQGNYGLVIGSDHLVLDIDPRNGGAESFQQFRKDYPSFDMLYTASVYTAGGGAHFYLSLPEDHGRKISKSLPQYPGLDWLSGNRYVVAPGSVNGVGSWSWAGQPVTTPPVILQDILEGLFPVDAPTETKLPEADGLWGLLTEEDLARLLLLLDVTDYAEHDKWFELMAICHHATAGAGKHAFLEWSASDPTYSSDYELTSYRWDTLTDEGPGQRPLTARSLVRCFETPPPWLLAKLNHKDASTLFSPLETKAPIIDPVAEAKAALTEYHGKIKMTLEPLDLTKVLWPVIVQDSRLDEVDTEQLGREIAKKAGTTLATLKRVAKVTKAAPPAGGNGDEEGINEAELHLSVVKGVIKRLGGEGNLVYQGGDFWRYNEKHWELVEDPSVQYKINRVTQDMGGGAVLTGPFISSVNKVLQTYLEPKKRGYWNPEGKAVKINAANGLLELDAQGRWQVLPHDKKHRMNYILPIAPEDTPTPHFDAYLQHAIGGDAETRRTLLAAMVYTVTSKKQWWKKCFFLHGDGDTGKSVFLALIEAMVGPEQRSSLAMKQLGKDTMLVRLRGKLLNTSGELDDSRVDTMVFKSIISGDSISADRKYQSGVEFNNSAVFWFAGNNWPTLRDESDASLNRVTLIEFANKVAPGDKDPGLIDKLIAELPGIFFQALQVFAEEYIKDEGMTIRETPSASKAAFAEFMQRSQPLRIWVEDRLEEAEATDFVTGATLYQDYRTWADNSGHRAMNEQSFKIRLPKILGKQSARGPGRNSRRGYFGVRLRSMFEE